MNLSEAKKVLNLGESYTPEEVKKNYRDLVKKFHPDKNPYGSDKFIKIQEAYEFINDYQEPKPDFIENILKSFNFKFNKVHKPKSIVITPAEYLVGGIKEIKEKNECRCPQPLCKNCLGTAIGCLECVGNGFIKKCGCSDFIIKKVIIPKRCNLNANNFVLSDNYKIINEKLKTILSKDQINKLAALKLKHFQKIRGIQTHLSN